MSRRACIKAKRLDKIPKGSSNKRPRSGKPVRSTSLIPRSQFDYRTPREVPCRLPGHKGFRGWLFCPRSHYCFS